MKELFATCVPFDKNLKAWIGGNPPIVIENQIPENYVFYATLVHPEKRDKMLSIIIYDNFDILIENNIYPNIKVKVLEHDFSEQGNAEDRSIKDLAVHSISNYKQESDKFLFIKVGGEPRFIQYNDYYYKKLIEDNYSFFLQIEEEGYSDELLVGNYPFMYGALYLYKHNLTGEVIAGFWQYS